MTKEEIPIDRGKLEILRADELFKEGECGKALHIYFKQGDRDSLIKAALDLREQKKEKESEMAENYLILFEKKNTLDK